MRMIDADSMKADLLTVDPRYEGMIQWCITVLDAQPTIEERKKGKWIPKDERPKQEIYICSVCNGWAYSPWIGSRKNPKPNRCRYAYCPNCGSYNGGD